MTVMVGMSNSICGESPSSRPPMICRASIRPRALPPRLAVADPGHRLAGSEQTPPERRNGLLCGSVLEDFHGRTPAAG